MLGDLLDGTATVSLLCVPALALCPCLLPPTPRQGWLRVPAGAFLVTCALPGLAEERKG